MTRATQRQKTVVAAFAIFALSTALLPAATWTWVGPNNGAWTLGENWDPATVPTNDGTAVLWITNFNGSVNMDGDWDIDTLNIGGATGMEMTLGNSDDTLTIRSRLYRHQYDPAWNGNNQMNCNFAIGANGAEFYNDYGGTYRYQYTFTDNGRGYDWVIKGGMDLYTGSGGASSFSGTIVLKAGVLYVRDPHALANAAALIVTGSGNFNTSSSSSSDKIGNATPVTMYGGTLTIAPTGGTEDIGDLLLGSGLSLLYIQNNATLQADRLLRGTTSPYAPALCQLRTVNAVNQFVKVDDTSGMSLIGGDGSRTTNKKIVPYITDYNGSTSEFTTLITYNTSTGLTPLNTTNDFVHATDTNFPSVHPDGNDNVLLAASEAGGTTIVLTNDVTINALLYYHDIDNNVKIDLQGHTLTLNSGVLIANNDLAGRNDNLEIINGTIHTGTASEMIIYSSMGGNYPCFSLKNSLNITGTDSVVVYGRKHVTLEVNAPDVHALTLVDLGSTFYVGLKCAATNAVLTGTLTGGYSVTKNIVRNGNFNGTVTFGEVHGQLTIKSGHSNQRGDEEVVIGDAIEPHLANRIRLLANGVLSPHASTVSSSGAAQFDGGIIGLSAYDLSYLTYSAQPFTVDLHDGQVVIDIFSPNNYDQVQVQMSEGGQANLSMSDGNHPGSELVVRLHYAPKATDNFTIVQVAGAAAITGKFSNGDTVNTEYGDGTYRFDISYTGDTGNDIVLGNATFIPAPPKGTVIAIK